MSKAKSPSQLMAPIPERAYQGIIDANNGKDLGHYAQPATPGKRLHEPFKKAAASRRKGGKAKIESVNGSKPPQRLDRLARKSGGAAKGKTNINIIIGSPKGDSAPQNMQPLTPPPAMLPPPPPPQLPPQMPPPGMPPPGMMPPGMMPPGGPGMGPPPIPRKSGGRLSEYKMDSGALSGEGRLDKAKWYGGKKGTPE